MEKNKLIRSANTLVLEHIIVINIERTLRVVFFISLSLVDSVIAFVILDSFEISSVLLKAILFAIKEPYVILI